MPTKSWFLIKYNNGRPEIVSKEFDSFDEAKEYWDETTIICETVFG